MSTSVPSDTVPVTPRPSSVRSAFLRWVASRRKEVAVWRDCRAVPPLAVWGAINTLAVMIVAERAGHTGKLGLSGLKLAVVATFAALLALGARALLGRLESRPPVRWLRLIAVIATAAPIAALLIGNATRTSWSTAGYAGFLAAGTGWAAWSWNRSFIERMLAAFLNCPPAALPVAARPPAGSKFAGQDFRTSIAAEQAAGSGPSLRSSSLQAAAKAPATPDGQTRLSLRRCGDSACEDRLEGVVQAEFAPAQSVAVVHLAFCPIFARIPQFGCEVAGGANVRVKGTAVFPYGCRIELKRSGDPSRSDRVEVRFVAVLSPASERAA